MTVIHILMAPQYLNSNHVTYYVITCKSAFDWVYAEQWYVIITSDVTWTPVTNKFPGAGVQISYVHSSIITTYVCLLLFCLTISILQACCALTTEYGIPSDFRPL